MEAVTRRPRRQYRTHWTRRIKAIGRRERLSPKLEDGGRGACINENNRGTHGAATHGCRCATCHETYKRSA